MKSFLSTLRRNLQTAFRPPPGQELPPPDEMALRILCVTFDDIKHFQNCIYPDDLYELLTVIVEYSIFCFSELYFARPKGATEAYFRKINFELQKHLIRVSDEQRIDPQLAATLPFYEKLRRDSYQYLDIEEKNIRLWSNMTSKIVWRCRTPMTSVLHAAESHLETTKTIVPRLLAPLTTIQVTGPKTLFLSAPNKKQSNLR